MDKAATLHPPSSIFHPRLVSAAVLIVCHNGREFLQDCLNSVLASDDGEIRRHVVVVDNASTDGSAQILRGFRQVQVVRSATNLGFAGGNNLGWAFIRRIFPETDYVALLNQDTVVRSGWLGALVRQMEGHPIIGCAQAKVMLHPRTEAFNTAGNESHYLGFGFTSGYGETDSGQFNRVAPLGFCSGAGMIVRADPLSRAGLFDETFFAYLEDADLSWKLRQLGYDAVFVPEAVVYHKYTFKRDYGNYFFLERNRWLLLATYYKTATIFLLLPPLLAMEIGQLYFAWRHGVLREKLRAYQYFLDRTNLRRLIQHRTLAQRRRRISDREFTERFTSAANFPELKSRVLKYVGNPLMSAYWRLARRAMKW